MSVSMHVCPVVCVLLYLSVVWTRASLSVCLFACIWPSSVFIFLVCLSVFLSVYFSIYLSVYLFVWLPIRLSVFCVISCFYFRLSVCSVSVFLVCLKLYLFIFRLFVWLSADIRTPNSMLIYLLQCLCINKLIALSVCVAWFLLSIFQSLCFSTSLCVCVSRRGSEFVHLDMVPGANLRPLEGLIHFLPLTEWLMTDWVRLFP